MRSRPRGCSPQQEGDPGDHAGPAPGSRPSAFIIAVLATLCMGVINRLFVTIVGINALITTLGTLAIFRGLTKVLGDGQTIRIELFGELGVARFAGIPLPVYIFIACVVIF